MFVKKDMRSIQEILSDEEDVRNELKLGRRPHEFRASVHVLCQRKNIPALKNLHTLSLYDNQIRSLKFISVLRDTPLKRLNLGLNQLQEIPHELSEIQTLEELWLESNELQVFPESVLGLANLRQLRLSNNHLLELPVDIDRLHKLETMAIDNNQITVLPTSLGGLTCLKTLIARGNKISALPDEIGLLDNLVFLALSSNQLRTLPSTMGNLTKLETVYANGNPIESFSMGFTKLEHLQLVNLSNTQIASLPCQCAEIFSIQTHLNAPAEQESNQKPRLLLCSTPYAQHQREKESMRTGSNEGGLVQEDSMEVSPP